MNLREGIIDYLKEQRQVVLNGGVNCIPSELTRFRTDLPGIQRLYYVVTGATKSSKTQFANWFFIFRSILYWLDHQDQISKPKIFYFHLEETARNITLRYYSYLIHTLSGIRISPQDLKSVDERKPLPEKVLKVMETDEFKRMADAFEQCVEFRDERNSTGMYLVVKDYMEKHGTVTYKEQEITYTDEFGIKKTDKIKAFDTYSPNDPNQYVIAMTDHAGLIRTEKNQYSLKEAIEDHSSNNILLRDRYGVTTVLIQQQNTETTNLDAIKAGRIRPTKDGLKDSKRPGEDCSVLLGITNPKAFDLESYLEYDITKLKDSFRMLEVVLNREGVANGLCPLFFDGAIDKYEEMPLPNNMDIIKFYKKAEHNRMESRGTVFMMLDKHFKNKIGLINSIIHTIKWIFN